MFFLYLTTLFLLTIQLSPTQSLSYNRTFSNGGRDFYFEIDIDNVSTVCTMRGPRDRWLAVGFGNDGMANTYTIAYGIRGTGDIRLFEDRLAATGEGTELNLCNGGTESCVSLLYANDTDNDNDELTVTWIRDNEPFGVNPNDLFIFNNDVEHIQIIWAIGDGNDFTNGHVARGKPRVNFVATTEAPNTEEVDEFTFESGNLLNRVDMDVFLRINENEMYVELTGPSDRWFGMNRDGHFGGDALIYMTDGTTITGYDAHLRGKEENLNGIDDEQNWQILEVLDNGDSVTLKASRPLETNDNQDVDFEFPPPTDEEYYFAHGATSNSYNLEYHGSNQIRLDINLRAGTASVVKNKDFSREEHGTFMILAFGVFAPWGALINRFLGFSICSKIEFLREFAYLSIQIHITMMLIAWILSIFGFITIISDAETDLFSGGRVHDVLGMITIIMMTMITFGTLLAYKQGKIVGRHKSTGDKQAINGHRFFGAIFIFYGLWVVLTGLGSSYGGGSSEMTLFLVYVFILIIIWAILEFYGCTNKDTMNKSLVNNNDSNEKLPIVFYNLNTNDLPKNGQTELVAAHSDEIANDKTETQK